MAKKKTTTVPAFDPSEASVFVAPDEKVAGKAVIVRNMWQGDFVFLVGDLAVEYIDLPEGFIDTDEEIAEARVTLDKLSALKGKVWADQEDDLHYVIDDLAADVHYAESVQVEDLTELEQSEAIVAFTARPDDAPRRVIAAD